MKQLRTLALLIVIVTLFGFSAQAQYRRIGKPMVRSFGSSIAGAPVLHRAKVFGGYEIRFPGRLPAARIDKPDGYVVNNRLNIAPGVEIRITETLQKSDATDTSPPPVITVAGRPVNLDIGKYLTDPDIWPHEVLNDNEYQLGRGWYAKNAFRYFGLGESFGKCYLGACWYSPRASGNPDGVAVVFQIDRQADGALKLTPVKAVSGLYGAMNPLIVLDALPNGNLVLQAGGALSQRGRNGEWTDVPDSAAFIKKNPQFAGLCSFWHRGKWLLIGSMSYSARTTTNTITVENSPTRRKVREFTWRFVDER